MARARDKGVPVPVWVEETTSTQDAVRTWAMAQLPEGSSLVAEVQTEGRGRLGRVWVARAGQAVQLSVLVRPHLPIARLPLLSLAVGVAVYQATRARLQLKWPNDLLGPDGRKVAGILCETELSGGRVRWAAVGIGVNVRGSPADVPHAGHLEDYGPGVLREDLAVDLVATVLAWVRRLESDPEAVRAAWRRASCTLGHTVRVGEVEGLAEDVAEDGGLCIRRADGVLVTVHAGDLEPPRGTETP